MISGQIKLDRVSNLEAVAFHGHSHSDPLVMKAIGETLMLLVGKPEIVCQALIGAYLG